MYANIYVLLHPISEIFRSSNHFKTRLRMKKLMILTVIALAAIGCCKNADGKCCKQEGECCKQEQKCCEAAEQAAPADTAVVEVVEETVEVAE